MSPRLQRRSGGTVSPRLHPRRCYRFVQRRAQDIRCGAPRDRCQSGADHDQRIFTRTTTRITTTRALMSHPISFLLLRIPIRLLGPPGYVESVHKHIPASVRQRTYGGCENPLRGRTPEYWSCPRRNQYRSGLPAASQWEQDHTASPAPYHGFTADHHRRRTHRNGHIEKRPQDHR